MGKKPKREYGNLPRRVNPARTTYRRLLRRRSFPYEIVRCSRRLDRNGNYARAREKTAKLSSCPFRKHRFSYRVGTFVTRLDFVLNGRSSGHRRRSDSGTYYDGGESAEFRAGIDSPPGSVAVNRNPLEPDVGLYTQNDEYRKTSTTDAYGSVSLVMLKTRRPTPPLYVYYINFIRSFTNE